MSASESALLCLSTETITGRFAPFTTWGTNIDPRCVQATSPDMRPALPIISTSHLGKAAEGSKEKS